MQAIGEREQERLLVAVMLVLGARERARRRHHRQERAGRVGLGGRRFEIGDVALDLRVRVGEGAVHHEALAEPGAQARRAVVLGIELREGDAVLAAAGRGHRVLCFLGGERPCAHARKAVVDVEGPIAAFAELAIADDVDADFGLLPDDRLDRLPQAGFVRALVIGLAILDLAEERDQLRRPHQAADMRGEDPVDGCLPWFCFFSTAIMPRAEATSMRAKSPEIFAWPWFETPALRAGSSP